VPTLQAPSQDAFLTTPPTARDAGPEAVSAVPAWAEANADDLLKFLYVSPRQCEALDRLLAGA
jgi:hypothetical protein